MGLGSKDDAARKAFKKDIAGKTDWKADIKCPNDAYTMIAQIKKNLEKDPNGAYIIAAYAGKQIRTLEAYVTTSKGMDLKEWSKHQKQ